MQRFLILVWGLLLLGVASRAQRRCGSSLMRHFNVICGGKHNFKRSFLGLGSSPYGRTDDLPGELMSEEDNDFGPSDPREAALNTLISKWLQRERTEADDPDNTLLSDYPPSHEAALFRSRVSKRSDLFTLMNDCCEKSCDDSKLARYC